MIIESGGEERLHTEAVVLEGAGYRVGTEWLLQDINLRIPAGQWVSLTGANGSGKSTLVKLLNGLLPVSEGRVVIDGLVLGADTMRSIRERIGIVFPNPDNQFVGLTVADDIVFGLENQCMPRGQMHQRLAMYSTQLGIAHLMDRHPAELSGGQKQRVAIAAVLAMEPQIVILDESTSMLDERSKQEIGQVVRSMHETGRYTIITVTHDWDEILATDRMIVLDSGSILADGEPSLLLKDEGLLEVMRLQPSFAQMLSRRLQEEGLAVAAQTDEIQLVEALWELYSKK